MNLRRIDTPLGEVLFHGRDSGRPVQLVITGAFADETLLEHNQQRFPDQDVWRAHLPGNHSPPLAATSIGAFGAAFSHALRATLGARKATVVGISTGALVAAAIEPGLVRQLFLADPPFRPHLAWPLLQFRQEMPPGGEDFVWQIFGIDQTRREPRDYSGLIERLAVPAKVVVGGEPLGAPRRLPEWPSLVDEESLRQLEAHPRVDLEVFETAGHHLLRADPARFFAALRSVS